MDIIAGMHFRGKMRKELEPKMDIAKELYPKIISLIEQIYGLL